jgi:hypothetical protein
MTYKLCDWSRSRDGPSSLYTRIKRLEGPKRFKWMKNISSILHGNRCIMFDGLLGIVLDPSTRGGTHTKLGVGDIK